MSTTSAVMAREGQMSTQSTTSTTPTFTGAQQGLQQQLSGVLGSTLSSGGMTPQLQQEQSATVGNTANQYAGLSSQLQSSLSGRGFGTSGAAITGGANLDIAKINTNANTGSAFAGLAQQNMQSAEGMSNQFGFADPGSNVTKSTSALSNLMQMGGLAFGLASMGSGGGGGGGMFSGLFGGGGGNMSDDSTGGGMDDYNAGGGFGG